jgi:hypothetical protein
LCGCVPERGTGGFRASRREGLDVEVSEPGARRCGGVDQNFGLSTACGKRFLLFE